jgi:sensor histidine kinase YesM
VIDDGLGMSDDEMDRAWMAGIGLRNVDERLRVIYGANYHLKLTSTPGQGTCARIEIPELVAPERISA